MREVRSEAVESVTAALAESDDERLARSPLASVANSLLVTDRGRVSRFLVQLEYWIGGEWTPVVRYDHDENAEGGHDVADEGLHRDVYRDGTKYRTESITGPIPADRGFDFAEEDLRENLEGYIKRFEQWHDVNQ